MSEPTARSTPSPDRFVPAATDVLLVIDVQNSFVPGGSLAVARGDEIVPLVNALAAKFSTVVLTQDWHPADHASFASRHPGRAPYDTVQLAYGPQVLWPDHCVQATAGADFAPGLHIPHASLILRKGCHREVDSYSAFVEADRTTSTGLAGYLRERGITRCFLCGLATDFCVAWSAMDARAAGFEAWVIDDACRAIDLGGTGLEAAWAAMTAQGVGRTSSAGFP
ncbi:MAG: bifunctional nicotinamidase/pyrazinamidase [Betaproteobacteria bacterium]|jgi:nicotinamidase/pyrazinamidase